MSRRYSLKRELGSGSLGTVYLAMDRVQDKLVALKILRLERLSEAAIAGIRTEFRAVASLRHPRLAAAYDFGHSEVGRIPFYTREYIPGMPLPKGPPAGEAPGRFLEPILDLLDALAYLHAHGVLHLDIHPGNLIVSPDKKRGSVLIDFALAPSPESTARAWSGAGVAGAPPERLLGPIPTARTDIFLAGRLLQYRLTGRMGGPIRLPGELSGWGAKTILDLERMAGKSMQPDPDQRFGSAEEFRDALQEVLGEAAPLQGRAPGIHRGQGARGRGHGGAPPEGAAARQPLSLEEARLARGPSGEARRPDESRRKLPLTGVALSVHLE